MIAAAMTQGDVVSEAGGAGTPRRPHREYEGSRHLGGRR